MQLCLLIISFHFTVKCHEIENLQKIENKQTHQLTDFPQNLHADRSHH